MRRILGGSALGLALLGFVAPVFLILAIPVGLLAIGSAPSGQRADGKRRTGGLFGSIWDDVAMSIKMQECPHCRSTIPKAATKCAHCGEWTGLHAPPAASDDGHPAGPSTAKRIALFLRRRWKLVSIGGVLLAAMIASQEPVRNDVSSRASNAAPEESQLGNSREETAPLKAEAEGRVTKRDEEAEAKRVATDRAWEVCQDEFRSRASRPATVRFRLFDGYMSQTVNGNRVGVTRSATAKNGIGTKVRYAIACIVEDGDLISFNAQEVGD